MHLTKKDGDSFLKYLTTFHIYVLHPDFNNDQMNTLRSNIVKNENLVGPAASNFSSCNKDYGGNAH